MDAVRTASESTAANVAGPSQNQKSSADTGVQPGVFTYGEIKGNALTVDKFGLKTFMDSGHYDDLGSEAKEVDDYIQEQARKRGLDDSQKSYDEITKELFKKIGESENEKPLDRFKRAHAAVQALKRMRDARLPEAIDWSNMTAKEIRSISGR